MGKAWDQFKMDMSEANAKTAAKHRENVNQSKMQIKEINAKSKEKRDAIRGPKTDYSEMTGTKFLLILWGTIATLPFLIIGLILFVIAGLFFWDAFIGL